MNHEKLIGHIKKVALAAMANLEHCRAECRCVTVSNVKVIGKVLLESLALLTDRCLEKAKKIAIPIFALSGLLLMSILMIF